MKAAYIPVGAGGHILSSLPMVTELVKRGVEVDYYAPESYREQVEFTGARHCVFPEVTECYSNPLHGPRRFFYLSFRWYFWDRQRKSWTQSWPGLKKTVPM